MSEIHMLLAIDPGETVGLATFVVHAGKPPDLRKLDSLPGLPLPQFVRFFRDQVRILQPDIVVVENYTVFASAAKLHIGLPLITSEIIGAIEAICTITVSMHNEMARVDPAKKNRWPDARLRAKLPHLAQIVCSTHEADAIKIGLEYIEREGLWAP